MVSLSVVFALVLLNCSQLISAGTVVTCIDSELHLRCDVGVIFVKSVTLGVQSTRNCGPAKPQNGIRCFAIPVPAVARWCNGLAECVVDEHKVIGDDPCFNPYTYYITTYTCVPGKTSVTCEGKKSDLKCVRGKIKIIAANYGRTDDFTCLERRPMKQHINTNCFSPNSLDLVQQSCEGKSQCTVSASNDVFSDPCVGTRKYLWISYYCSLVLMNCGPLMSVSMSVSVRDSQEKTGDRCGTQNRIMAFLGGVVAFVLLNCGLLISVSVSDSVQDTQESDFDSTVITCRDSDLRLRCGVGVIFIKSARFGRRPTRICGPARPRIELGSAKCLSDIPHIPKWCNGRAECVINWERIARSDHCFYTHYTTTYICVPAETTVICEFESGALKCEHGRIKILAANYGRTDDTTCLRRRPYRRHQNTECYSHNSLGLVSERCEGKKYCSLSASNDVFSDPCFGTRKYLQVTYSCPAYEG
ncbi:uncharacterized protein LOC130234590 [Danio aesculapii]|uniref:uncharacterized protein LOC130234590 n=1 Tax=Danio aesculapii TaxID=1142201 RepID=UPI0024C01D06|nr:uncharacterized protein LOC130234590 [Danio aesculapii]